MPDEPRTQQLQIRVSPEQKRAIKRLADRAGLTMSNFVLSKVLPSMSVQFQNLLGELASSKDSSFAFAELLDFLAGLSAGEFRDAVAEPPAVALEPYWSAYVASTVEHTAARLDTQPPGWTRDVPPLEKPVFGSSLKSVRWYLLTHSPPAFSQRNIFINANVGERV